MRDDVYSSQIMKITDVPAEVERIKKELSELIVQHLKENSIDAETARKQAADFLGALPINDQKDLLEKLKKLSEQYFEVRQIYLEELTKIHEMNREEALSQMRNAIKLGNIDHAIEVAKTMREKGEI